MKSPDQIKKILKDLHKDINDLAEVSYEMKRSVYEAERALVIGKVGYKVGDTVEHRWLNTKPKAEVVSFHDMDSWGYVWVEIKYFNNQKRGNRLSKKSVFVRSNEMQKVENK